MISEYHARNERLAQALRVHPPHTDAFAFDDLATLSRHGINGPWLSKTEQGRTVLHSIQARWVRMVQLTQAVCDALDEAGLRHVVLKGVTAAATWPTPWLRSQSDVDVLVHPRDFEPTLEALIAAGVCTEEKGRTVMHAQLGTADAAETFVEVHHRLAEQYFVGDLDALIDDFELIDADDARIPALAPVPRLAHLLVHAANHACHRYLWLLDIAALAPRLDERDWQRLVRVLREWHAETAGWWALTRARSIASAQVPPTVLAELRPRSSRASALELLGPWAEADASNGALQRLFRLSLQRRDDLPRTLTQMTQTVIKRSAAALGGATNR